MSTRRSTDAPGPRAVAAGMLLTTLCAVPAPAQTPTPAEPKVHACAPLQPNASLPSSAPVLAKVDEAALRQLPGRYQFLPDLLFTVTRRDNRLFARLGDDVAEMLPLSGGRFFIKEANLELTVQRGPNGQATCLIAREDMDAKPMPRVE